MGIWACKSCTCLCLSWALGWGICLPTSIYVGIVLLLRVILNMLVRNASPRGPMCFRCLIFSLPWPCELLVLRCVIASWTRVVMSERGLCVFRELCSVRFLVVGESPSVLLWSIC